MKAADILDRVSMQLNDTARTRWTERMLLNYLTDAMRQTVLNRPDANAKVSVMKLEAGQQRQSIPDDMLMLLRVTRNMGDDGKTPGKSLTTTTREAMDSFGDMAPNYEYSEVFQYAFVQTTPRYFWVYPLPSEDVYVELECAGDVPQLMSVEEELPLSNIWAEPLREYCLYRAFSLNGTSSADRLRASDHLQQYYISIGNQQAARTLGDPYRQSHNLQGQGS